MKQFDLISKEGTIFESLLEAFEREGYSPRLKTEITRIQGYRLTKPLGVEVYQTANETLKFVVFHVLPSLDGKPHLIEGRGTTLEEACQKFVEGVVERATSLAHPDSTTDELQQRVVEKQYLGTILIQEY